MLLAAAAAVVASLITAAQPLLHQNIFLLYLVVVLGSALFGGVPAGFTASLVSVLGAAYAILAPHASLAIAHPGDRVRAALLLVFALLITLLSHLLRTARRKVAEREQALVESETSYRDLFDNSIEPLFIVATNAEVMEANPAAAGLFGMSRNALVGCTLGDLTAPDRVDLASGEHRLHQALDGDPQRFEWWGRTREGRPIPLDITLSPTLYFGERAILGVARDMTERRALEEQLRQSQKMDAMGRLAAGVSHDFNNLLTTIRGHADLISRALSPGDPLREDLGEIERAADLATHVTRQLLAFSRASDVGRPERIPLNPVVEGLEKMLHRVIGSEIEFVLDLHPESGAVLMDAGQLEQVVLNLVVNARDAMPHGGTITITSAASVNPDDGRREASLAIRDTGAGMDEDTLGRVFEPFFTTKAKGEGTGLGLSTVYGIVERSGGRIRIESAPGRGTTFHLHFPAADSATAVDTPAARTPHEERKRTRERILLVEDQEPIRSLMRRVLTGAGHEVEEYADVERALERFHCAGPPFTLLATDLSLGSGSGTELAQRIREADPMLPVLFFSGSDRFARGDRPLPGPASFLPKPFRPRDLVRAVDRLASTLGEEWVA